MKITGNSSHVKFDLENGYVVKADGEMLVGGKFVVFKDSMKNWEPPIQKINYFKLCVLLIILVH
ncbi:hypothetical protein HCJ25_09020 [Listeria sp. FSL L7-1426]|uniref:hypothetical protein n=1 Tax=Listeria cossartiae TaxID=2838249 RepID=UPI001626DC44|nr:hypothetical protein [Listeria cossartiae]MBC1571800.1 hypothetical protein [Listeria cossartiae subsp. cossartiae]